jgi:predicted nuclease of restriction endonuclease-like RecB superfamily
MKPPMLHTAYKATTTRNAYGDYVSTGETALACHFREITNVLTELDEVIQSDAMAWFEPDSGVEKLDILKIYGTYYRVEKVTKARRLRNPNVLFIKTELLKYGAIS